MILLLMLMVELLHMMVSLMPRTDGDANERRGMLTPIVMLMQMKMLLLLLLLMINLAGVTQSTIQTRLHPATTATALSQTASAAPMEPSSQAG